MKEGCRNLREYSDMCEKDVKRFSREICRLRVDVNRLLQQAGSEPIYVGSSEMMFVEVGKGHYEFLPAALSGGP
jgi:hypothetical protein